MKVEKKVNTKQKILSNNEIISILDALKKTSKNKTYINNLLFLNRTLNPEINEKLKILTKREKQILHLIGIGKNNNTIASELDLSISTIETHRKNIRKKLGLVGNGKLLEYAILCNTKLNLL